MDDSAQAGTAFWKSIGLPGTLGELGIPKDRIDEMAARAVERGAVGAFVPINKREAAEILKLAS